MPTATPQQARPLAPKPVPVPTAISIYCRLLTPERELVKKVRTYMETKVQPSSTSIGP